MFQCECIPKPDYKTDLPINLHNDKAYASSLEVWRTTSLTCYNFETSSNNSNIQANNGSAALLSGNGGSRQLVQQSCDWNAALKKGSRIQFEIMFTSCQKYDNIRL